MHMKDVLILAPSAGQSRVSSHFKGERTGCAQQSSQGYVYPTDLHTHRERERVTHSSLQYTHKHRVINYSLRTPALDQLLIEIEFKGEEVKNVSIFLKPSRNGICSQLHY